MAQVPIPGDEKGSHNGRILYRTAAFNNEINELLFIFRVTLCGKREVMSRYLDPLVPYHTDCQNRETTERAAKGVE